MKKRTLSLLTAFVLSVLIITGCSKDDDDNGGGKTKTELITTGTWKLSTVTVGGADASPFFEDCDLDDILTFVAGGTGSYAEGATKCDMADPDSGPFTWAFLSSETLLHVSLDLFGASGDPTITTLSETQLVLTMQVDFGGTPQTVVATFIH